MSIVLRTIILYTLDSPYQIVGTDTRALSQTETRAASWTLLCCDTHVLSWRH